MEYSDLEKMTVVKLREEAMKFPDVKGVSAMKKEQLIELLCEKLGIEKKKRPQTIPLDKAEIKRRIKQLKEEKKKALEAKDYEKAAFYRRRIHAYKHRLRKSIKKALQAAG